MQLQHPTSGRSTGPSPGHSPPSQAALSALEGALRGKPPWEGSSWPAPDAPDTSPPPLSEVLQRFRAHHQRQDGACSGFGPGTPGVQPMPSSGFGGTHPMGLPQAPDAALSAPVRVQFREAWQGLQVRELDSQALFNHFFGGWPR